MMAGESKDVTMVVLAQLREDVAEFERLLLQATRRKAKDVLSLEIRKLQTEIVTRQESLEKLDKLATDAQPKPPTNNVSAAPRRYTKELTTYAWDQSDKFMKIYVTLDGVQNISAENITVECKDSSFRLQVNDLDGKDYILHVAYLFDNILPTDSYHKVKKDCILVMLRKVTVGRTWAYVIQQGKKEKKRPKVDADKSPDDGLMDMLKNMYDDGDDDMKRTISKAWSEREKNGSPGDPM